MHLTPRQQEIHDLLTSPMSVGNTAKAAGVHRSRIDQVIKVLIKYGVIERKFRGKYTSLQKK